jgi:hypothetical protein
VSGDDYNRLLNAGRTLVGVAALAAPGQAFRGIGLDARGSPQLQLMTRMFGVREVVLGAGALSTSGEERRRWLQATIAADAGDALVTLAGHRAGHLPTGGAVLLALAAGTGVVLGALALSSDD